MRRTFETMAPHQQERAAMPPPDQKEYDREENPANDGPNDEASDF